MAHLFVTVPKSTAFLSSQLPDTINQEIARNAQQPSQCVIGFCRHARRLHLAAGAAANSLEDVFRLNEVLEILWDLSGDILKDLRAIVFEQAKQRQSGREMRV